MSDWLSVKDLAREWDCSEQTIWSLLRKGEFPGACRLGGTGRWRIPREDVRTALGRWNGRSKDSA